VNTTSIGLFWKKTFFEETLPWYSGRRVRTMQSWRDVRLYGITSLVRRKTGPLWRHWVGCLCLCSLVSTDVQCGACDTHEHHFNP